jgi:hypothetical protein
VESDLLRNSPTSVRTADLHEAIRQRAEEIYIESGRIPGGDEQNWSQAEQEIWEQAAKQGRRNAIVLKVNGTRYVGEYSPESSDGYVPGEFSLGSYVAVRFEGDKMFVERANGKELETRIVKVNDETGYS